MRLQHERCFHYAVVRNEYVGGFGQTIRLAKLRLFGHMMKEGMQGVGVT